MKPEEDLLARADQAFRERRNPKRAREAFDLYQKLCEAKPDDPEPTWHLAMAHYFVGIRLTENVDERIEIYNKGQDLAKRSIKLANQRSVPCAPCHFWTAILMALYGKEVGIFKMIFTLNDVVKHAKESVKADPSYAFGGAYRLLGLIEQKLPGIFGGSNAEAKEYFEKAIEVAPDEPLNYLFLARLLVEEYNDMPKALEVATGALKKPFPAPDRIEAQDAWEDLKNFVTSKDAKSISQRDNKG